MRGYYPYAPKLPFVQGYDVVGDVDGIGAGVTGLGPGDRVAALTVHGGYAEYLYRGAEHFVRVPDNLDDAELVALILNYATAYQMIHRVAAQRAGESALVTGASGGGGQALLELIALLADGKLRPKIAARLPLLDARRGNELVEQSGVDGKIVLVRGA
jgi:NADPH:quinone reductase